MQLYSVLIMVIMSSMLPSSLLGMASEFDTDNSLAFTWFRRPLTNEQEDTHCAGCSWERSKLQCGACKIYYCSSACQKNNWSTHKKVCIYTVEANKGNCAAMRILCDAWINVAELTGRSSAVKTARQWLHRLMIRLSQEEACLKKPKKSPFYVELLTDEVPKITLLLSEFVEGATLMEDFNNEIFWVRDLTENGLLPQEPQIPGDLVPENERYYKRIDKLFEIEQIEREIALRDIIANDTNEIKE